MVRDALEGRCSVESDAEVPANTRRIDLWVTPHEGRASPPDHLGLLGRITSRSVTVEFFHNGTAADVAAAVDSYDQHFHIGLTAGEKSDLVAVLRSL